MTALSDEALASLKATHGEIFVMVTASATIAFRCPTRAEHMRFVDEASSDKKSKSQAIDTYARSVVVHPDRQGFAELLDRRPGLAAKVAAEAGAVAMDEETTVAKKA